MSQPPPPPRRRNAPVVVYPGSPPPVDTGGRAPAGSAGRPQTGGGGGRPPADPRPTARRPAEPSRRGNGGGSRKRTLVIVGVVIAVLVIAGGAFALTSGGGGKSGPEFKASTAVDLKAGDTKVEFLGFSGPAFPPEVRDQVLSSLGTYVEDGIVKALRTGKADDAGLDTVFDAAATARLTGPERATLLDEGLPKAVGEISVTTPAVAMTALADKGDALVLISASVDFKVKARAEKGTITIQRTGSFVFAPDEGGAWKITGWTLSVTRGGNALPAGPASATTTTAGQ
jgi:hypothetical protein